MKRKESASRWLCLCLCEVRSETGESNRLCRACTENNINLHNIVKCGYVNLISMRVFQRIIRTLYVMIHLYMVHNPYYNRSFWVCVCVDGGESVPHVLSQRVSEWMCQAVSANKSLCMLVPFRFLFYRTQNVMCLNRFFMRFLLCW